MRELQNARGALQELQTPGALRCQGAPKCARRGRGQDRPLRRTQHATVSDARGHTHTPEERAEIEAIFSLYDDDGSGRIDVAGLFLVLHADPAPIVTPVDTPVVTPPPPPSELSAALVDCGWEEAHVTETLSSLDDHQDSTGVAAGVSEGQQSEGRVKVTLDSFLACLLAASRYKSVFST